MNDNLTLVSEKRLHELLKIEYDLRAEIKSIIRLDNGILKQRRIQIEIAEKDLNFFAGLGHFNYNCPCCKCGQVLKSCK